MDLSKLHSVEAIRAYLESELGIDTLMEVYPIIKGMGDDILLAEKIAELKKMTSRYLKPE